MRFCMVSTFYPPFSFGGDAISVQHLSHALVRRGHEVTVVHDVDAYAVLRRGPMPAIREEDDDEGVRVIRLKSRWGALSSLAVHQFGRPVVHAARFRELFRPGRFDAVVFHNPSLIGGPAILTWPEDAVTVYMAREHWLICPTHVLWRHGRERCDRRECLRCVASYRRPPQAWRYTGAVPRALGEVDVVIALSEFSRQKHREFGLTRRIEVLPNFMLDSELEPSPGESVRPQQRRYFLFAGRLERIKGLDDVLPVFGAFPDVDLLIAGKGDDGLRLQGLAADLPNVRFLGLLPPSELRRYYRHAVACLVPSVGFEAFPRVLIEALSAGIPVVARDIGPAREVIAASGAGVLFSSPDELRARLASLLEDPGHRDRLARLALPSVREHWAESVVIPRFLDHIEAAARRRARHRGAKGAPVATTLAGEV